MRRAIGIPSPAPCPGRGSPFAGPPWSSALRCRSSGAGPALATRMNIWSSPRIRLTHILPSSAAWAALEIRPSSSLWSSSGSPEINKPLRCSIYRYSRRMPASWSSSPACRTVLRHKLSRSVVTGWKGGSSAAVIRRIKSRLLTSRNNWWKVLPKAPADTAPPGTAAGPTSARSSPNSSRSCRRVPSSCQFSSALRESGRKRSICSSLLALQV